MAKITYLRKRLTGLNYLINSTPTEEPILLTVDKPELISGERAVGWLGSPDFLVEFEDGDLDNVSDEVLEWYSNHMGAKSVTSFRKSLLPTPKKRTFVEKVIRPKKVVKEESVKEAVSEESLDEAVLADESE